MIGTVRTNAAESFEKYQELLKSLGHEVSAAQNPLEVFETLELKDEDDHA